LRMECATGDGEACYELGRAYETRKDIWGFPIGGDGVRRDDGKAARYFFLSCEDGVRAACRDLGRLYETGKGVARDQAAAARFYRKACGLRDGGKCEGA